MISGGNCKVRVGDTELLVEAVAVAGSEPTATRSEKALDALDRAQEAIVEMASSTAATISEAARRGARPAQVEVEFGLKISVKGDVILAGAASEASLRVLLTYDANSE